MDPRKRTMLLTVILFVIILVGSTLYSLMKPGAASLQFEEEYFRITDNDGIEYRADYSEIESIEHLEHFDYGQGPLDEHIRLGKWTNDTLGQYICCCDDRIAPCIVIRTAENSFVLNYESPETTAALFRNLKQICSEYTQMP